MIDWGLFAALISLATLWVVIRINSKANAIGQLNTLVLTQITKRYTVNEYPEEELQQAVNDWESWDSEAS
jgi:negative regulator of sigma E activity